MPFLGVTCPEQGGVLPVRGLQEVMKDVAFQGQTYVEVDNLPSLRHLFDQLGDEETEEIVETLRVQLFPPACLLGRMTIVAWLFEGFGDDGALLLSRFSVASDSSYPLWVQCWCEQQDATWRYLVRSCGFSSAHTELQWVLQCEPYQMMPYAQWLVLFGWDEALTAALIRKLAGTFQGGLSAWLLTAFSETTGMPLGMPEPWHFHCLAEAMHHHWERMWHIYRIALVATGQSGESLWEQRVWSEGCQPRCFAEYLWDYAPPQDVVSYLFPNSTMSIAPPTYSVFPSFFLYFLDLSLHHETLQYVQPLQKSLAIRPQWVLAALSPLVHCASDFSWEVLAWMLSEVPQITAEMYDGQDQHWIDVIKTLVDACSLGLVRWVAVLLQFLPDLLNLCRQREVTGLFGCNSPWFTAFAAANFTVWDILIEHGALDPKVWLAAAPTFTTPLSATAISCLEYTHFLQLHHCFGGEGSSPEGLDKFPLWQLSAMELSLWRLCRLGHWKEALLRWGRMSEPGGVHLYLRSLWGVAGAPYFLMHLKRCGLSDGTARQLWERVCQPLRLEMPACWILLQGDLPSKRTAFLDSLLQAGIPSRSSLLLELFLPVVSEPCCHLNLLVGSKGKEMSLLMLGVTHRSMQFVEACAINPMCDPLVCGSARITAIDLAEDMGEQHMVEVLRTVESVRLVTVHALGYGGSGKTQFIRNCVANYGKGAAKKFVSTSSPAQSLRMEVSIVETMDTVDLCFRDFPGQRTYHTTHIHGFTNTRAVFAIFDNPHLSGFFSRVRYWLGIVCTYAASSSRRIRCIIVFTHRDLEKSTSKAEETERNLFDAIHELLEEFQEILDIWPEVVYVSTRDASCQVVFDALVSLCQECKGEDSIVHHRLLEAALNIFSMLRQRLQKGVRDYLLRRESQRRREQIASWRVVSRKLHKGKYGEFDMKEPSPVCPVEPLERIHDMLRAALPEIEIPFPALLRIVEQAHDMGVIVFRPKERFVIYDTEWYIEECVNRYTVDPVRWREALLSSTAEASTQEPPHLFSVSLRKLRDRVIVRPMGAPDVWSQIQVRIAKESGIVLELLNDRYIVPTLLPYAVEQVIPKDQRLLGIQYDNAGHKSFLMAVEEKKELVGFHIQPFAQQYMFPFHFHWKLLGRFLQMQAELPVHMLGLVGCSECRLGNGVHMLWVEPGVGSDYVRQVKSFVVEEGLREALTLHRTHVGLATPHDQMLFVLWDHCCSHPEVVTETARQLQQCLLECLRESLPQHGLKLRPVSLSFLRETFCLQRHGLSWSAANGAASSLAVTMDCGNVVAHPPQPRPMPISSSSQLPRRESESSPLVALLDLAVTVYVPNALPDLAGLERKVSLLQLSQATSRDVVSLSCAQGVGVLVPRKEDIDSSHCSEYYCALRGTQAVSNVLGDFTAGFKLADLWLQPLHASSVKEEEGQPLLERHCQVSRYFLQYAIAIYQKLLYHCPAQPLSPHEGEGAQGAEDTEHQASRRSCLLYLCGHSLGGAAAVLVAVLLTHRWRTSLPESPSPSSQEAASAFTAVRVLTLGAPLVGDGALREQCQAARRQSPSLQIMTLAHGDDPIPRLLGRRRPGWIGENLLLSWAPEKDSYEPVGELLWLHRQAADGHPAIVPDPQVADNAEWMQCRASLAAHSVQLYRRTCLKHAAALQKATQWHL
jgi:hypothetical protein